MVIIDEDRGVGQAECVPDPSDAAWWTEQVADTLTPLAHEPCPGPTFGLAGWIEHEAARYLEIGTDAASLVYDLLWKLAREIRFVGANTPGEFLDRLAAVEAEVRG
jgi:hypothetical protein